MLPCKCYGIQPSDITEKCFEILHPPSSIWLHYAWPGFPFLFCILQAIKDWRNEAKIDPVCNFFPRSTGGPASWWCPSCPHRRAGNEWRSAGGGGVGGRWEGGDGRGRGKWGGGHSPWVSMYVCVWFFQWWLDSYHIVVHTLCNVLCSQTLSLLVEEVTGR